MKSYVTFLKGLYTALLSDVQLQYPTLQRDCFRDLSRLLSLVDSRGLPFLMVDLPKMGKHFDKCLSQGQLTRSSEAGQRPYKKGVVIPRLFKGLLRSVFDDFGVLCDHPDPQVIKILRQLYYGAKKVTVACDDSITWEHVNEFFRTDQECRSPSLSWDEDDIRREDFQHHDLRDALSCLRPPVPQLDLFDRQGTGAPSPEIGAAELDAVQWTADLVASTLGRFKPSDWRAKHGPGAVADQDRTQFKYEFPSWPAKLSNVFPQAEFGFANYGCWADYANQQSFVGFSAHEPPSKLISVPKTLSGPRLIASEPVAHQWCQQAVKDFLVGSLWRTPLGSAVHFRDQTPNQRLAREASHTQSHVTVDLSSASDRLSCWVVERIFRRNSSLLEALHATRTRWVVNTIDRKSPKYHVLKKFACMGSACTFPVQSYVFAIACTAAVLFVRQLPRTIRGCREAAREVLVFGDDMIVPIDCWGTLRGILGYLGLEVNCNKTFDTGKFRESCGVDAYDGHDVTPTYTATYPELSRPESVVSVIDTHNNFVSQGYCRVADYLKSTVLKYKRLRFPEVPIGSGVLGWFSPLGWSVDHLQSRWNAHLQRREYRSHTAYAVSARVPVENDSSLLQFFTEAVSDSARFADRFVPLIGDRIGIAMRPKLRLQPRWESYPA
nr:MAG: putative replicase protein [Leviviridae sp.]